MPAQPLDPSQPRPSYSADLLASLDQAGAGQGDPGATPPHAYIPAGPVEAVPYEGYCPPESGGRRSRQS